MRLSHLKVHGVDTRCLRSVHEIASYNKAC